MNSKLIESLTISPQLEEGILLLSQNVKEKIVFSTSFGIEDQVITHAIYSQNIENIVLFTLDTGRLFTETLSVKDRTQLKYNSEIESYYPNAADLEKYIDKNGPDAFYNSIDLRKECCNIRKVEPLGRALQGASVWITGLRAEQSKNRNDLQKLEWDEQYKVYKYNPLLDWTYDDVVGYTKKHDIPYNPLHDKGYVSIGCAPCTKAIRKGEDFRAGRWWWENNSSKECGLHK